MAILKLLKTEKNDNNKTFEQESILQKEDFLSEKDDPILKKLESIDYLFTKAIEYKNELIEKNKKLTNLYNVLTNIIYAADGYIWAKKQDGRYIYCDPKFCEEFFKVKPDGPFCNIEGKTDLELINEYRNQGHVHTFGELCVSTDQICLERLDKCHFIEIGKIDNETFALDVVKTPLIISDNVAGVVGFGRRIPQSRLDQILDKVLKDAEKGKCSKVIEMTNDNIIIELYDEVYC